MLRMQKLIKKKVTTLDVDAFVADIAPPSTIPEANQKAEKRKAEDRSEKNVRRRPCALVDETATAR